MSQKRIIGIGSKMGRDDAIGLELVDALSRDARYAERCSLLPDADVATVTLDLLENGGPVLLVDAADMGIAPGEYRCFNSADATIHLHQDSVSTHGWGLAESMALAQALGFDGSVEIFAAQPFDLSPQMGLTLEMCSRFDVLLAGLREAVEGKH